ncbi:DUF6659 family protein [Nitrosopumilus adriaticus]|uniref:Roadblock/LAMTOR2 domain-containing protein n=1 Tax=Nitrosopumilus adriaticus TaxID=1580092 RepID=A0A0D5C4K6_9ARCH|nr:DUF6659 family protein [Nitrosopumilus adriaticus]AJW71478.1 hypothetical protein NADRNF5_1800 [Nitrosopumilus adriaticus]
MEVKQMCLYDEICKKMSNLPGINFAVMINNRGRKISECKSRSIPLETDEKKLEMLFMETTLDMSMRKEFDNSFGKISAIVSFRENTTMITIPHQEDLMLLSVEPGFDHNKIVQTAYGYLTTRLQEKSLIEIPQVA